MTNTETRFRPEIESDIQSFALGCIVGNTFVTHFFSGHHKDIYQSRVVFVIYKKRILIQLKTFEERLPLADDQNVQWNEDKFELSLNLSQVKTIHFDGNYLVIKSISPPLLFRIVDIADNNDQTYEEEKELNNNSEDIDNNEDIDQIKEELDSGIEELIDIGEEVDCIDVIEDIDSTDRFIGLRMRTSKLLRLEPQLFTKTNCIRIKVNDNIIYKDIASSIGLIEPLIQFQDCAYDYIDGNSDDNPEPMTSDLPFAVLYSLQALTNISYQLMDSLKCYDQTYEEFVKVAKELTQLDENAVEKALNDLQHNIEDNSDIKPIEDLRQLFDKYKDQPNKKWTNDCVVMVRRCVLTPTRVLLLPALPLQQSRFLRTADPEFVIRVLIKDEDMQMLSFTVGKSSLPYGHEIHLEIDDYLNEVIVDRLQNGIHIAGRTYELLGASTSQLRDHGLVMCARDLSNRTAEDIRRQLGNLEEFRNPAKFIARIGQTMSQSMGFLEVDLKNVEMIDDIEGGSHPDTGQPFVFSDGVGRISPQMAKELCTVLHIKPTSTFQIRLAGFKGIVVVDPNLTNKKIQLRPQSMKKFDSDSDELDVLKVSEPRTCYLNRPLVVILNNLGIKNEVFLELLYTRHKQLVTSFDCDCKAINTMKAYSAIDFSFNSLLKAGIHVLSEPFFVQILQSIITKISTDLKNKARIQIPYDSARVMYGVLDETKTLEYGQVFVQYSHSDGTKRVLTGDVVVTKYPCMHPGDVRKLIAVNVPELHHIYDSIVFPAKGERPHPDEMAGSDLDGDEYSVIWYQQFIFDCDNHIPMWFPSGKAEDIGRNVTDEDILMFYKRFILENQVGLLASSHLAWSDLCGLYGGRCYKLAHKYAVALDYAKTGINSKLRSDDKPKRYPDFMMKDKEKPTYKSDKALGQLFVKNCYFHQLMDNFWPQDFNFEANPRLIDPNANKYMTDAKTMFRSYKTTVKDLMNRFGIESEAELMSVTFNKTNKSMSTKNDSNDTYELITNIVKHLISDYLKLFESGVDESERPSKASAWYQVSHQMNSGQSDTYYGFGWIAAKYLVEFALKSGLKEHVCLKDTELSSDSQMIDKKMFISVFKGIVSRYLQNYSDINTDTLRTRIEDRLNHILNQSEDELPLTAMASLFLQMSDITDFEKDFEVGLTSLMAFLKCKRLGLRKALNFLMKSSPIADQSKSDCIVLITAITEEVAKVFGDKEETTDGEDSDLITTLKEMTGVRQIDLKYGFTGHESFICVVGNGSAVRKFNYFIHNKSVYNKIRDITFKEDCD